MQTPESISVHPGGAGSRDSAALLVASDLSKTYRLGKVDVPVLRGASIAVRPGEWVAVLGASGSGKSTLLHLLGGLDTPDRNCGARIEFRGRSLAGISSARLDRYRCADVGFVFQFYHLLPELNVVENVSVPARVLHGGRFSAHRAQTSVRAIALLEGMGLGHRLKHRPNELSGGERQRVAIARALINDPPLLLADEPTGNLDRRTGGALLDSLVQHRGLHGSGLSMVLVTHDREVAARADRIVELVDGRVVER